MVIAVTCRIIGASWAIQWLGRVGDREGQLQILFPLAFAGWLPNRPLQTDGASVASLPSRARR